MPFNVGDVVQVQNNRVFHRGRARVQRVLPPNATSQDLQEYVVEFSSFGAERFRFGLCREFEMLPDLPPLGIDKE